MTTTNFSNTSTRTIAFALTAICLFACSNPRYISSPSVHNAAFFRQQGDFKLSVAGAGNPTKLLENFDEEDESLDHSYGFDGQAAVAVTDHFLLTVAGNIRNERDKYNSDDLNIVDGGSTVKYNRQSLDIGAGFYTPMGSGRKAYFNGAFGVGFGKMTSEDNADPFLNTRSRRFEANTLKYFFHPSFNMFFNDYLRMSVAPRFSLLKLNNISTNYTIDEENTLGYNETRKRTFAVFEPSILLQAGFKNNDWLKLDFGFNFSSNPFTTKTTADDAVAYPKSYNVESRNFLVSLGLSFYPMGNR